VTRPSPVNDYPVLLDQPAPHLLAYTPESAIAEKYQAIVELDLPNSRMKDFHDVWTLARNLEFDGQLLSEAIRRTFERRKTKLPNRHRRRSRPSSSRTGPSRLYGGRS
jgi:hypothetical protein